MFNYEKTKFSRWIVDDFGIYNLLAALKCNQATVNTWLKHTYLPSVAHMRAIVKLSKGVIDYPDMIEPHFKANGLC